MSIEKLVVVDQITVAENGVIFCREATRLMEGDTQLSQTFHRTTLIPGQDISGQTQKVQDICNAAWTNEVIEQYRSKVAE